jgi:predicted dehydrogenase
MWSSIIRRNPDVVHSAVVDIDTTRVSQYLEMHPEVSGYTDLATALREGNSQAVLLVTPPDGHLEQASKIFGAGLPLLAEKPLTLELAQAVQIVGMAKEARLPLMVGLNFRFLPVSRKLRKLVIDEEVGQPGFAQFTYQRNRDGRVPRLNKYPLSMRHPMMLEQSIHHLDLIRYCYDREVTHVTCRTFNPAWSMYAHDSNVSCLMAMEGGLEVNYLGTWTGGWNELSFEWRTDCSDGVIIQRQLFDDLCIARTADPALTAIALEPCEPFYDDTEALLDAFLAHLRQDEPLQCSGVDHLHTLALCFAAIESSRSGQSISMEEFYARNGIPRL